MHLQSSSNFWNCLNQLEKGFNLPGHVSHSASTRGGLSVWALGARGALGRYPEDLSAWACGTRGTLGRYPGGVSRLGHWGHVAHSEGIREGSLGLGTRDTWLARATSGGWLFVWASGTRGELGRLPEGS